MSNPFQFLIHTVMSLVRSCIFVKTEKKSPFAHKDSCQYVFTDNDELDLISNFNVDNWWFAYDSKLVRNAIATIFSHISYENKEFQQNYLIKLSTLLNQLTFDRYKIVERPLVKLIIMQDSYQAERIKKFIGNLGEIIKNNIQNYKEIDSLVEILFKVRKLF